MEYKFNKKTWLDYLYYKIGKQQYDFRLSGLNIKDGNIISTKWKRYSVVCFPLNPWESGKIWWVNTREILPCEVVIDLEQKDNLYEIVDKIKVDRLLFYVFDTHSKGYHIHIFFKEILTNEEKLDIIKRYGGDEQKAYQGTTIALEYAKHWKSNKIKEMVLNGN